jgi:uncharacterized protein (TIGR02466 family)
MNEPNIELLFPVPIMFNKLDREFTKTELDSVNKHCKSTYNNYGNKTSNNNYILNEPEFKDLHDIVLNHINKYVEIIVKPKYEVTPYITQSWLNYTKHGEYHHKHEHPNSYLSGVLYINANEEKDTIYFHQNTYQQIYVEPSEFTVHNSQSWWFKVKTGGIVLFPSHLTHHVDNVTSDKTRISLSFNTFIKGTLGNNKSLTELIIK